MHRKQLLELLAHYNSHDPQQIVMRNDMISFVEDNPLCFERSLEIGHITASAWLINKHGTHALLTHHAKFNTWLQLGGHCDGDADVLRVALKEAHEESGITKIAPVFEEIFDIDIHTMSNTNTYKCRIHLDVRFLLQVTSDENYIVSPESKDLRWISQDITTLPIQSPSLVRMFNKWIHTTNII
jgi:8-oxo-dGTP pyrophosphatase MutT (NUDIX family)